MTIKTFFLCTIALLVYAYGKGQEQYAADAMPALMTAHADAVVREEHIDIVMKSPTHVESQIKRVVTVQHKQGKEYAAIKLYYNNARSIKKVKGVILSATGQQIGKFSLKDFQDQSATGQSNLYDDSRVKTYNPAIHTYPYTISYTVEIKDNQSLIIPAWSPDYNYGVAVEKSVFTFTCPSEENIRFHESTYDGEVEIITDDKGKTYRWTLKNCPALRPEPYSPPRHQQATTVRIVPENFEYFKKAGHFTNWEELGKWYDEQLLADKRHLPMATVQHILDLTKDAVSPKEKARLLYKYLQDKTRYISIQVGIGGLEPFSAETVDRLGYGDCKALVNYMQSLLNVVHIPSYYCIVEAGAYKKDMTADFANVADGNHIILCIPFEQDTTWLECTSQKLPFGFLGDFTSDRLVVACTPAGGKLLRTPAYDSKSSEQRREAYFTILEDGSVEGEIETVFRGGQLDNHYYNTFLPLQEQLIKLKEWYDVDNITFKSVAYNAQFSDTLSVKESMNVYIKHYVANAGAYFILHPNIFNHARAVPTTRNRNNDLYINQGFTDVDIIHYKTPAEWNVRILPAHIKLETDMGSYELHITMADGVLTSSRTLSWHAGHYPKEKYAEFHAFMKEVASADRTKYNLTVKQ